MRTRITNLEQELRAVQDELAAEQARPAPSTEREDYLLGEVELVNRHLECQSTFS